MARVKSRWNQNAAPRSLAQMANAVGASIWKLGAEVVLNLENENFETSTQRQRVDLLEEMLCFLVHCSDRWLYERATPAQRGEFIDCLVRDLARLLEDSRIDVQGGSDYQGAFIDKLNQRTADYATYSYSAEDGCSFAMRCRLGEQVQLTMGARDNRWIPDYIVGREAPAIESALRRTLVGLVRIH